MFHEWQCRPTAAYFFAILVSAAIDPYRKSDGNAASSSASCGGSSVRFRRTASPRKTCVPGVHAHKVFGVTRNARHATTVIKQSCCQRRYRALLYSVVNMRLRCLREYDAVAVSRCWSRHWQSPARQAGHPAMLQSSKELFPRVPPAQHPEPR